MAQQNGKIKVLMNGALGKMGRSVSAGLAQFENIQLVAAVDNKAMDTDYGFIIGSENLGFGVGNSLAKAIEEVAPDVVVDFTNPAVVMKNVEIATALKTPIVVGTTGFTPADIKQVETWCAEFETSVFIASNFALGAVLMMKFAQEAAKYMPHIEVIERHHDQKLDAPSGTAVTTMEMIGEVRTPMAQGNLQEFERLAGSRGGEMDGMRVHSVRLPGYVATQEVIFGEIGQILTIRHDAINRDAYVPGVKLAVEKILEQEGLVQGLENIL